MKKKLIFSGVGVIAVLACILAVCAAGGKSGKKVYKIGVLSGLDFFSETTKGFQDKMADLGYKEGENVVYDIRNMNIDIDSYKKNLRDFVTDSVDLIFVYPTEATIEAKELTQGTGIPVVFSNAFTEDTGIVNSIREPGGNITGVRWAGPDLAIQRFEILYELVPKAHCMWVPYQKGYPIVQSQLDALKPVFEAHNVEMVEIPAGNAEELKAGLERSLSASKPDAILIIVEPLLVTPESYLAAEEFARANGIPFGGAFMPIGKQASLFGVIPQSVPQGIQAAFIADKILKGIPAGTVPVVSAEAFFLMNYKAALESGISVPEGLLRKAHDIIR